MAALKFSRVNLFLIMLILAASPVFALTNEFQDSESGATFTAYATNPDAGNAFNGVKGTGSYWQSGDQTQNPGWLCVELDFATPINATGIYPYPNDAYEPTDYTIVASNGTTNPLSGTWAILKTVLANLQGDGINDTFANNAPYLKWCLNWTKWNNGVSSGGGIAITEFEGYNNTAGVGGAAPPSTPGVVDLTVTAVNAYDGTSIRNFTVSLSNATHTLTNGTTSGTVSFGSLANITTYTANFSSNYSGGFFNKTASVLINLSTSYAFASWQSEIILNATEIITGSPITGFNASVPWEFNVSNGTGFARLLVNASSYTVNGAAAGYVNASAAVNTSALSVSRASLQFGTGTLNVTAREFFRDTSIGSFAVLLWNGSYQRSLNTSSGSFSFSLINGTYNLNFTAAGYVAAWYNVTFTGTANFTGRLFASNSIYLRVFDERTNLIIADRNTTAEFVAADIPIAYNFTRANGTFYLTDFVTGTYSLGVQSVDGEYPQRNFIVSFSPGTNIILNAYMLNLSRGQDVTFFVRDPFDKLVEGANLLVTTQVNDSFVTVGHDETDFTGSVKFFLSGTKEYRIQITTDTFNSKVVTVTPSSPFTYTIYLREAATIDFTRLFSLVDYALSPEPGAVAAALTNFSLIVNSPTGIIDWFSVQTNFTDILNLSNITGSPGGGTATITLNLTNETGRSVYAVYRIKAGGFDEVTLNRTFYVGSVGVGGPQSFTGIADLAKADLSPLMRIIIAVVVAALLAAFLATVGVPGVAAGFSALAVLVVFASIGWVSKLLIGVVLLTAIVVYISQSRDGG